MDWLDIQAESVWDDGSSEPLRIDLERLIGIFLRTGEEYIQLRKQDIERFTPTLRTLFHRGFKRAAKQEALEGFDIIVLSYQTLRMDIKLFKKVPFTYLVLDEAQVIKNPSSQVNRCVRLIRAEHRLSLTGTPVENNTVELWAQMNFLNPGLLGSLAEFKRKFTRPIEERGSDFEGEVLKKTVYPFILRRKKEEVLADLPPKEEILLYVEMEPEQRRVYHEVRDYYRIKVSESLKEEGIGRSTALLFVALLRLRQAAIFPSLAAAEYEKVPSCKFELFKLTVDEILTEGHKVLVFSQFVRSLAILRDWVRKSGIDFCYLDGATHKREEEIHSFQENEQKKVFLISLKAGGLGINLTAADYVIIFDPWWNPAVEEQAVGRSHRIGQQNKVFAYKLITRDTVEEKILALQAKKKRLVEEIVSSEKAFFKSLNREDILHLFD